MNLEGANGEGVVGGDENHGAVCADQLQDLEPVELGHLDIEEQQARLQFGGGFYGFETVGALGHDFDFRMLGEIFAQNLASEVLVVDDHSANFFARFGLHETRSLISTGRLMATRNVEPSIVVANFARLAIAGFQALANIHQTNAAAAARRRIGIEQIFDDEIEVAVAANGGKADPAALDQIGDAVADGVFDQRLKQQGRDLRVERFLADGFLHVQTRAVADFFDGQKGVDQRHFFFQRDSRFFAEAERPPQEIAQQDAHLAGFGCIGGGEGADGIQAVEKEVRIHLCFECAQFGFAGQNAGLHDAGFGLAGGFDGQQDVVETDGQEIEKDAGAEDQRVVLRQARVDAAKFVKAGEHAA